MINRERHDCGSKLIFILPLREVPGLFIEVEARRSSCFLVVLLLTPVTSFCDSGVMFKMEPDICLYHLFAHPTQINCLSVFSTSQAFQFLVFVFFVSIRTYFTCSRFASLLRTFQVNNTTSRSNLDLCYHSTARIAITPCQIANSSRKCCIHSASLSACGVLRRFPHFASGISSHFRGRLSRTPRPPTLSCLGPSFVHSEANNLLSPWLQRC